MPSIEETQNPEIHNLAHSQKFGPRTIRIWIDNYIYIFMWGVTINPYLNFNNRKHIAWVSYQLLLFYMDMIAYPCPNPDDCLINLFL